MLPKPDTASVMTMTDCDHLDCSEMACPGRDELGEVQVDGGDGMAWPRTLGCR